MESHDIAGLVREAQAGSRESFGELVERHQDMVYAVCYRMVGNHADAEDLAHDAFVEAFLKLDRLAAPERFSGWLRTLTRNVCLMWLRRHVQMEELEREPVAPVAEEVADVNLHAMAAMADLPAAQRLILVLHYWEKMTYEEIAGFLGVPVGTVMSRLSRARAALRNRMDDVAEGEDVTMKSETAFKEEVDAEVAVLLRMNEHGGEPVQRLRVMFDHDPQRLRDLICNTDDPELLADLGRAIRHIRSLAFGPIMEAYLSPDPGASARAFAVLKASMWKEGDAAVSAVAHTPPPRAYMLADALIAAAMSDARRSELVADLLDMCRNNNAATLLTCVLMCYPEDAARVLLERFRSVRDVDELYRRGHVLYAMLRTGADLCEEVVRGLSADDPGGLPVALAAAEGLAQCLDKPWLQDATPTRFAEDQRRRIKWAPLKSGGFPPGLLARLKEAVVPLTTYETADVRNSAIRALGLLRDTAFAAPIRAAVQHEDPATRVAAVMALGELGDANAIDLLAGVARKDEPRTRIAAIEVLGRLKAETARPLLAELARDPDVAVCRAAVTALGEIASGAHDPLLRELLNSGSKAVAKAAAKALYRDGRGAPPTTERGERLAELRTRRLQKIRGDARPVTHQRLDAALRLAFPEIRTYSENEVTQLIAGVCGDYSWVRRSLIYHGFMRREQGKYEFTELGKAAWRVERFITEHYLLPAADPASPLSS